MGAAVALNALGAAVALNALGAATALNALGAATVLSALGAATVLSALGELVEENSVEAALLAMMAFLAAARFTIKDFLRTDIVILPRLFFD